MFTVFTETVEALEPVVAGVNFGEMVEVVPTGIGLVHVVVTLNAALAGVGAPRKGEARVTGWLPMFETVNTPVQGELLPVTGQPAGVPDTPETPMDVAWARTEQLGLPVYLQDLFVS